MKNISDVLSDRYASAVLLALFDALGEEERQEIFSEILNIVPTKIKEEESILEGRVSSRAIRRLITLSDKVDGENAFSSQLLEKLKPNLKIFSVKRGSSFVVVSLLESENTKKETKAALKGSMAQFKRSEEAGAKVILKLMSEK
eukprot:CAMPEP_0201541346 /NCGR_PEP_ID=MMETSP0161_2-20130828/71430_1 /ASSEMBLY_ACC=CAM_ASM_000251 /TAXON_ID=180227 /ORGANISM="Neoparamoeba aestuarina, Strain SoJaBio B1-5/56/2" /LENGTH=143 /DNA_ID=CAMNT_0047948879 /DNA_START=806 /DNA_END=1237 /DNA_ORIENTATION=+